MKIRASIDHVIALVRFLLLMAADRIHISAVKDGIKLISQSGRDVVQAYIYGKIIENAAANVVVQKPDLKFLIKSIQAWSGGKSASKTLTLDINAGHIKVFPTKRPSCWASIPTSDPTEEITLPASWTTTVVADFPAAGMKGTPALINKGPTAAPEKGVTRISVDRDRLRLVSSDGVGLTEHCIDINADGCIEIDLSNEILRKVLATGLLSEGLVSISRNEEFVKISKDGCTLITALAPASQLETVLGEIDRAIDCVDVRVNLNKLKRACKTISGRKSNYLRITFHDGFAEVFDATQLVPRNIRRVALRPNRQYHVNSNLDATIVNGEAPPSLVVDANALLKAIKPFSEKSEVRLSLLGGEEPSIIVVQGKSEYPRCIVATPKLLGRQVPSTIRLSVNDHLRQALDVAAGGVEPLAKKWVWLAQDGEQLYLHCLIEKKRESDGSQFPVLYMDLPIDGTGQLDGIAPLPSSLLGQIIEAAKDTNKIDIEVGEDEESVSADGHPRFTEQLSGKDIPWMALTCPVEEYGTVWSAELARALDEILPATDTVPGAGASIAIITDGRTLTATAGSYTRRASFEVKGQEDLRPQVKALWPKYFVANFSRFLLGAECEVRLKSDGETLLLSGDNFTLAFYPHIGYHVTTQSPFTSVPGSALYLLDPEDARQVIKVIDAARSHHRDPSLFLWYEGGHLHTQYQASGDGPALSIPVQIEKELGTRKQTIEVGGEDLKNALQSSILYASSGTRIFLDIKDDKVVHIGRLGRPNFSFEISQITRLPYKKRGRLEVYPAIGPRLDLLRKSNHNRALITYHGLPPRIKNHPEEFPNYRLENGLDQCHVMLDNGAFHFRDSLDPSTISGKDYIEFILANESEFSQFTMNDDYTSTNKNNRQKFQNMRSYGLDAIDVFHAREPMEALEKALNGDYGFTVTRIGWGGAAADNATLRINYVARATSIIEHSKTDLQQIRIHGFGMLQLSLIQAFPFDSVDASSFFIWAQNFQLPSPFGMLSLRPQHANFVLRHPLVKEIEPWVRSLSYEKASFKADFTIEKLAEDNSGGMELRQLCGISYYRWLEEGFKYIDHMRREQRFIPMNELQDMGPFIYPETENVPRSNAGNMKPIRLDV